MSMEYKHFFNILILDIDSEVLTFDQIKIMVCLVFVLRHLYAIFQIVCTDLQ